MPPAGPEKGKSLSMIRADFVAADHEFFDEAGCRLLVNLPDENVSGRVFRLSLCALKSFMLEGEPS